MRTNCERTEEVDVSNLFDALNPALNNLIQPILAVFCEQINTADGLKSLILGPLGSLFAQWAVGESCDASEG